MLRALLVGIDEYRTGVAALRGCVADVEAIARVLDQRVAPTELDLRVLRDADATRDGVVTAFREHLGAAGPDDVALFWYSGHGSTQPSADPGEPSGLDQTLVLVDSRADGGRDLVDHELGALVTEAGANGAHVVVVLDCCHSGSGTRDELDEATVRRAPGRQDAPEPTVGVGVPGAGAGGPSGWSAPVGPHVLIAACRADQTAKERRVAGQHRGVLSAALEQSLSTGASTYREWVRLASAVARGWADQDPQLEVGVDGDVDLRVFSGAVADAARTHLVVHEPGGWTLDAGALHAIPAPSAAGTTELALLVPEAVPGQPDRQVGTARVVSVGPATSTVEVSGDLDPAVGYRAVVTRWPSARAPVRVGDEPVLAQAVEASADLVRAATPDEPADLAIEPSAHGYRVLDLHRPGAVVPVTSADEAVQVAQHVSRWYRVRALDNPGTAIDVSAVRLELVVDDGTGSRQVPAQGEVLLPYVEGRPQRFVLSVTNGTAGRLYGAILGLTQGYAVVGALTPGGVATAIDPGQTLRSMGGQPVTQVVPDDLWRAGHSRRADDVVVLLSTDEFTLGALTQGALDVDQTRDDADLAADAARGDRLAELLSSVRTREWGADPSTPVADWAVLRLTLVAERPLDGGRIGEAPAELVPGVRVRPHPSLRATARLTSRGFATRDGADPVVPPGLLDEADAALPFSFVSTRDGAEAVDVLTLTDVQGDVTYDDPLVVELDGLGSGDQLLVTGRIGDVYVPVGYLRDGALVVTTLPDVETTRSLGGAIRLLVTRLARKVLRRSSTVVSLALVTRDGDGVARTHDESEIREALAARTGASVLVLVHGILGDTEAMAAAFLAPAGPGSLGGHFDVVLTFDYENLDTPLETTATALRDALARVGLGEHDERVTLIAHSMGGLVSRWMIEKVGKPAGLARLITAGTPHAGSPWSTVEDVAVTAITFGLNRLAAGFWPAKLFSLLVGALERVDTALDQMKPGSALLQALDAAPDPGVPYTALSGNTSLIEHPPPEGKVAAVLAALGRVVRSGVDLVFLSAPHDIAVATTSSSHVPAGRSPAAVIVPVACNHFAYFASDAGVAAMSQALAGVVPGGEA